MTSCLQKGGCTSQQVSSSIQWTPLGKRKGLLLTYVQRGCPVLPAWSTKVTQHVSIHRTCWKRQNYHTEEHTGEPGLGLTRRADNKGAVSREPLGGRLFYAALWWWTHALMSGSKPTEVFLCKAWILDFWWYREWQESACQCRDRFNPLVWKIPHADATEPGYNYWAPMLQLLKPTHPRARWLHKSHCNRKPTPSAAKTQEANEWMKTTTTKEWTTGEATN